MTLDALPTHVGALSVLELLAREAPAAAYDELVTTARRAGAGEEEIDSLKEALALALTVRTQLGRRQQREAGLSALVDTARDLTLPYDLDALLKVITRRARLLLNLDMAYISFYDEEAGDSYVRTADGHATALTVGFRVPGQAGLGRAARDGAAPFWTADYMADERITHHPVIDEVVNAEGIHALLAVPLRHRDAAFGVLYSADRNIRHFTPDEIALMSSLGDLATVAIEKARVLSQARTDIATLEQYGSRAKSDLTAAHRVNEVHRRMIDLLLDGSGLTALTALTAEALDGAVAVLDLGNRTLAATGDLPEDGLAPVAEAMLEAQVAGEPIQLTDTGWLAPVTAGAERLGCLLLHATEPLAENELRLLRLAAGTTGVLLLMQRNTAVAESQVRDEFFEALLSTPQRPLPQLRDRARSLGIDLESPHAVVVIRPEGGSQGRAVVWAASYALRCGGLSSVRSGCLVLLLPSEDPGATARRISQELSPLLGHPVTVGAAGPTGRIEDVEPTYSEALRCLSALSALGGSGSTASARELGFLGLLLGDHRNVTEYIAHTIGPVIDYDAHRFTNLVQTLESYFESGNSPTYAAESLHVHPNTVSRRLERITALLGEDWQEPARALEVQLALRLHRTRDTLVTEDSAAQQP
ncbi:helix-turn-helix domain-containing protein [Streptomyces sp. NPDC096046]|uniref:helix-turn-helix domain-containing protein n=1 Tax=Streptomyces sp. NPDC096046 TaxID=3155542 RepID=UPI00331827B0